MKQIILAILITFSFWSCSKDDDSSTNTARNIVITDIGFEYNSNYKVQHLQQINSTTWDYVDYSPNIYLVILNSTDIKETNQYGTVTNKYSLVNTNLSIYPNPQNYISCNIDLIQNGSTSVNTLVVSPKLGCRIYKENGNLYLNKPIGSSKFESFRFIKQ